MLDIGPCSALPIRYVPRDVAGEEAGIGTGWVVSGRAAAGWGAGGSFWGEGLPGLAGKSHRPSSCPHRVRGEVEVVVAEMRREHPWWGAKRIRLELLRRPPGVPVPSERTINRIFARQGLVSPRPRKRPRDSFR